MKTFWTFLTGVTAGAVIALFYAPDRGTETRRKIADSAKRMAGDARSRVEEGIDELSETGERIYNKAGNMAERVSGKSGSSRSNY
ncbi:MAG: YtxH domain-containing protein [Bacteroidetes bacterium]|nr:YtxH domain-containing protein [Bacteroidota bacterium]